MDIGNKGGSQRKFHLVMKAADVVIQTEGVSLVLLARGVVGKLKLRDLLRDCYVLIQEYSLRNG